MTPRLFIPWIPGLLGFLSLVAWADDSNPNYAPKREPASAVVELTEMPGYKTAWHQHNRCEESFYILEGTLTIKLVDTVHELPAGSYVFIPRGTPHGQGNFTAEPVRLLTTFAPGGFDQFFEDRVALFKVTKPEDPAFRTQFDQLRAKHSPWVQILGTWERNQ